MRTRVCLAMLAGLSAQVESSAAPVGSEALTTPHTPPSYRLLDATESEQVSQGQSVFDTQWVPAGTRDVARREGLGPLFNAASCDACHIDGARGQGPIGEGPAPVALVIQLQSPSAGVGPESIGDPVYGRVFNTAALDGVRVEGAVTIRYREVEGYYYPDGIRWRMRVPHYQLIGTNRGPLARTTIIKPRLAPALFGVGLLEAVPETAISDDVAGARAGGGTAGKPAWQLHQGERILGRFGWQGESTSIRDQATKAFAREMGLTTADRASDDCTPVEVDCLRQHTGVSPEVSEELLGALVSFLRTLAVPVSPLKVDDESSGSEFFVAIGCAACHRPQLPVELPGPNGGKAPGVIAAYTDLRLHNLGVAMADEDASGAKVVSKWRTAPLWGLGYRAKVESHPTFLHDGRARSTEEAILWHFGEAAPARRKFMSLLPRSREALLRWLDTL